MATVVCDVREDLRNGREPFTKIMTAVATLGPNDHLVLLATFEPQPLYRVLVKQGFEYRAERTAEGDWKVTVFRPQR